MLPTFVIGLREGLEAALIVAIIAAFLRRQGRRDLIRWVFIGVGTAVLLCAAAGVALHIYATELPQRQQEGLETVIGALAVGMVTYMVVWMKRHSRELKGQLETLAGGALAADGKVGTSRASRALVLMAFLAVLREGIETVIFLLAVFDQSSSGSAVGFGAVLGILVAVALGYGIYRGGVRLNLSKFFRATGFVLVLVAAGLVVNALHTAHEAGWLNAGQGTTFDLTWLVDPGSVQSSLLTGMLGLQPRPVVIEVIGWLVYFVPVAMFVAWPPGRSPARASVSRALLVGGAIAAVAALMLAVLAPSAPAQRPAAASAQVVASGSHTAQVRLDGRTVGFAQAGSASHDGVAADIYIATTPGQLASAMPTTLSYARVAALNGGRLPIGVQPRLAANATVHYADTVRTTVWIAPRTQRIIDIRSVERVTAAVASPDAGTFPLSRPVRVASTGLPKQSAAVAASAARADSATLDHRALLIGLAWTVGVVGALALLAGAALAVTPRRRPAPAAQAVRTLVNS
jgi:high-affinity iron transporter